MSFETKKNFLQWASFAILLPAVYRLTGSVYTPLTLRDWPIFLGVTLAMTAANLLWPFFTSRKWTPRRSIMLGVASGVGVTVGSLLVGAVLPFASTLPHQTRLPLRFPILALLLLVTFIVFLAISQRGRKGGE